MEKVINYITKELNIKYGDTIVVGVSGGPDSMVLLDILNKLRKAVDINIICAHVNHNVRAESADEKKFVENYCLNNNIVFEYMKIEDYGDDNFHNEARSIRYKYFETLIKKYYAKFLFTAHHGDDLIETILMRIVRGSSLRGYSGFSKEINMKDYQIVRPLINVTKEEIITHANLNNIKYVTDASNEKDVYTRNRFRKYIVPKLKKEDNKLHDKFYQFSKTLQEYNDYIDKEVEKKLKTIYPEGVLRIDKFLKEEHIIQIKIINYILEKIYQDDLILINNQHVNIIENLIKSSKPNAEIHLPNNIKFIKSYDSVTFTEIDLSINSYEIEIISNVNLPNGKNIEVVNQIESDNNNVCRLSKEDVVFPLHVRNRQIGDKMYVKGMIGRKKISDIFIDEKISLKERETWPVVVDSTEKIVWIPGIKKSKFDKQKNEKYDIILRYY